MYQTLVAPIYRTCKVHELCAPPNDISHRSKFQLLASRKARDSIAAHVGLPFGCSCATKLVRLLNAFEDGAEAVDAYVGCVMLALTSIDAVSEEVGEEEEDGLS